MLKRRNIEVSWIRHTGRDKTLQQVISAQGHRQYWGHVRPLPASVPASCLHKAGLTRNNECEKANTAEAWFVIYPGGGDQCTAMAWSLNPNYVSKWPLVRKLNFPLTNHIVHPAVCLATLVKGQPLKKLVQTPTMQRTFRNTWNQ